MRSIFVSFGFALMLAPLHGLAQGEPVNALWNSGKDKAGERFAFWIYPSTGGCPDLLAKGAPLVFAAKNPGGEQQVADLRYCFAIVDNPLDSITCRSGKVRLALDLKANRYKGEYSVELVDGSKREGAFVAEYCAPAKQAGK